MERFRALAGSFGGDLRRWPDEERAAAERLLARSEAARRILAEELGFDLAVGRAGAALDVAAGEPGSEAAALARLRSGVAARIAPFAAARPAGRRRGGGGVAVLAGGGLVGRPVVLMGAGAVTVLAGLLIGALQATPPAVPDIMALLQATPLTGLP